MYLLLKHLHMTFAFVSIAGFVFRSLLAFRNSPWLAKRSLKTLPHINDSLLLAAAIGLAIQLQLNPLTTPWLGAKIGALIFYIALGAQVIKQRGNRLFQGACFALALSTYAYIIGVAFSKSAMPWASLG